MTILGRSEELVSRCIECDLAEPESLASLGGSAPGVVDGILSTRSPSITPCYNLCPRPNYTAPITHTDTGKSRNTATSLRIPQLATSGSAQPPTNLDNLPKASQTIVLPPPTPSSSSPSAKSHATNAQPMHDSSAVFTRKNLNHITPASQSVVIL